MARNCTKYLQTPRKSGGWSGGTDSGNQGQGPQQTLHTVEMEPKISQYVGEIDPIKFWDWADEQPEDKCEEIAQKLLEMKGFP